MLLLEKPLENYLEEAIATDAIYSCEMSFYRQLSNDELTYMTNQLKNKDYEIICYPCKTCERYTEGREKFHLDRVMKQRK